MTLKSAAGSLDELKSLACTCAPHHPIAVLTSVPSPSAALGRSQFLTWSCRLQARTNSFSPSQAHTFIITLLLSTEELTRDSLRPESSCLGVRPSAENPSKF